MRDIFEDHDLMARFFNLLECTNPRDRCYVYRVKDGEPLRPAVLICIPYPALIEDLCHEHGGGDFQVMIRRGSTMILSGLLRMAEPI
ncbi:MAG: hypothetical protein ACE5FO_14060 [Parvularculaceae bacterium]